MFVKNYKDIEEQKVGDGAINTTIRWLIKDSDGAPNFYMRLLEINENGQTPAHSHAWEHEVYILEGEGLLVGKNEKYILKSGDYGFVPSDEYHYFENTGNKTMKMLCLIPAKK